MLHGRVLERDSSTAMQAVLLLTSPLEYHIVSLMPHQKKTDLMMTQTTQAPNDNLVRLEEVK